MKLSLSFLPLLTVLLWPGAPLPAVNLTWDTASGDGAVITPGNGTWDLVGTNQVWNNGTGNVAWTAANTAVFGGADGTYAVNVGAAGVAPAGITFSNSGYTLDAAAPATIVTNGAVNVATGKTATIGSNLTLNRAATFTVTGGGLLTLNGKITGSVSPSEITGGATLDVRAGAAYTIASSMVVGAFNAGTNLNGTLNINGGAVSMTNTAGNFVLGNIITAGSNTTSVVNLNSGSLSVALTSGAGLRFGNGTPTGGTVNATFNLNGGTVSTQAVARITPTGTGVVNATFNFNGGTLVAIKTNPTFLQNLTTANVKSGGAKIDSGAFDITIAQNLLDGTGGGGLEKLGSAALTLAGNNTYTGTTTITAGTLNIGNGGASGSVGTGPLVNNTTNAITINRTGTLSIPGAISGACPVVLSGSATVTLGGVNTYSGTTSVNGGRLNLTGSLTSDVTVASGAGLGGEGSTTGALIFGGNNQLYFDPSTVGSITANTVNATVGTVTLNATAAAAGTGLVVIDAPGGITGPISNFVFTGRGTPYFNGTSTKLLFDFAPGNLKWKGQDATNPTFWDVNTTTNWLNGAAGDKFITGDAVTFDDTASTFTVAIQPGSVAPGPVVFANNTNAYTLTGDALTGAGSLTKSGAATLMLANPNTYTGGTTIQAGTLQLGDGTNATGSLLGNVLNNAIIVTNYGVNNATVASTITGNGALTQSGTGTVVLTGNNAYTGITTITAGTLQVGAGGTIGSLGTGNIVDQGALVFNRSDATTVANEISGSGNISQTGAGATTLTGNNSYDGLTTISAGSLVVTTPNALGSNVAGTVVPAGGELRLQGGVTVTGETLTFTGNGNTTTNNGPGALRSLTGNNVWTGNITAIPALAVMRIGSDAGLLTISGNITTQGAATDQFVLQGAGNLEITGVISGTARVTCSSNGNPTSVRTLSGANTYATPTNINGGTLSAASFNSVVGGSATSNLGAPVTVANGTIGLAGAQGTLRYTGTGETTDRVISLSATTTQQSFLEQSGPSGKLIFSSSFTATGAGPKTLTLTGSTAGIGEIGGLIPDSGPTNKTNLLKQGTGTWILNNENGYTGTTTIQEGTLALGPSGAILSSPVISISPGATFDVTATAGNFFLQAAQTLSGGTTASPAQVAGNFLTSTGSILSPGTGAGGVGTLNMNGGLVLGVDTNLNFDLGTTSDKITVMGALELAGKVNVTNATGVTGTFPIITYTGARTGSGLILGSTPPGLFYSISTSTPGVVNLIVSATPPAGFANWQSTTWPGETNVGIIGPQADPDLDGIQNLIEYALGLDGTVSAQAGLPTMTTVNVSGTDYLALSVTRPLGSRSDLTYIGEFSDSLAVAAWTAGLPVGSITDNGNGTETIIWRDTVANTANRRFGRLRVTQN